MKIIDLIRQGNAALPEVPHEVSWILSHFLGCASNQVVLRQNENVDEKIIKVYNQALHRRTAGEPLQYILGRQQFMSLEFMVSPSVLIPRWDSEVLVEKAIALLPKTPSSVADIGTGSGALAISIAHYVKNAVVDATDISAEALEVAKVNALDLGVSNRVHFCLGDLAAPLAGNYDLIISNPPYISEAEMLILPNDVLQEPHQALFGGIDGLAFYRRLSVEAVSKLKIGGYIIVEIGDTQGEAVKNIFSKAKLIDIEIGKNYDGKYRYVTARRVL